MLSGMKLGFFEVAQTGRFCSGGPHEVAASANAFKEAFNVLADESIMVCKCVRP